ncbi:hypothetical protein [Rubrobacter indicoceani]|uniref:hypothetical protein n=1 Tax=Rubrobacter indicoceani TaxID=2051957 RepID=UPI000E5BF131|nr:hypothetical protein [Rubrobacter indicoceani]
MSEASIPYKENGSTQDFSTALAAALKDAARSGVKFSAGGSDLEWERFNAHPFDGEEEGRRDSLLAFESDPVVERSPGEPDGTSRLSYFLDGVQTTEEIGRIGTVPVVMTTVAAAIAHRADRRLHRLDVPGVPTLMRALILPHDAHDPGARALYSAAQEQGFPVPVSDAEAVTSGSENVLLDSTQHEPHLDPADYSGLKQRAYQRASSLRAAMEVALLERWSQMETGDSWIAVDGQLPAPTENAVGLIKNARKFFFGGEEARMLLDLEAGKRTTAFVPPWRNERMKAGRAEEERASWYVRMWPASASSEGADATSGLIRVETNVPFSRQSETFDEISRWILAEKAPLARPDLRWASMIYPIHYVEKILKPTIHGGRRTRLKLEREIADLK